MLPIKIETNENAPDFLKLVVGPERDEYVDIHELLSVMPVINFDRITEVELSLHETDLTTKDVALIAASDWSQQITKLDLKPVNLTNATLKEVAKLKALRRLALIGPTEKITHLGLRCLANLPLLKYIYFRADLLNRKTVEVLSAISNLSELGMYFGDEQINDQTLSVLSYLKTSQPLDLILDDGEADYSREGLCELVAIKNLRRLKITGIPQGVTRQTVRKLFAGIRELQEVTFRGPKGLKSFKRH